jgi:hypothetical protein
MIGHMAVLLEALAAIPQYTQTKFISLDHSFPMVKPLDDYVYYQITKFMLNQKSSLKPWLKFG